jgi:hypothetical protein
VKHERSTEEADKPEQHLGKKKGVACATPFDFVWKRGR